MKIFFYKALLIFIFFLLAFHFSFNYAVRIVKQELNNNISKEKVESIKLKIKNEMKTAINKENFIKPDDAILINKFLDKIKSDLEKRN